MSILHDIWYDYRSEIFFAVILSVLTVFSYWLAAFIPEDIFEKFINPIECICTSFVCFYGAWLLYRHHDGIGLRKSWARILIFWGVICVVMIVVRYTFHITAIGGVPSDPLYNASLTLGNILAWLLIIYPSQVLRPGWLTWWRALLQVIPMVLLGIVDYYLPANLMPLIMLYPAGIFLTLCSHIRKYRQWCEDNFSSMDNIDAQWIVRYLIILLLLGVSFYFISFWFVPNRMFTQQWLLLFILAYSTEQILFRPDPWKEIRSDISSVAEDGGNAILVDSNHSEEMRLLKQWMGDAKPYLNTDFQLSDIRQVLPRNRTYLSKLIRNEFGGSFYQFVNTYRLNEAKRLMVDQPWLKIAEIAVRTGFSSPSVFTRTFTKELGILPSEWVRKQKQSVPKHV